MNSTDALSNLFLERAASESEDPVLKQAYGWSLGINRSVEEIVRGVPPFNGLRPALDKCAETADLMVVSATPMEGRYPREHVLKIGDAPGDLAAAKENGVLFYPIIPGKEDESWKIFTDEIADLFFSGAYGGEAEISFIDAFYASLPENAPWS